MLDLPLDPTDDRARPAFTDAASCRSWLQQLQLTNLHQAHGILRAQLDEFNRYPLRAQDRLQTLELLRETIVLVQRDYAKKLISKKLPLSHDELTVFVAIAGLWQGLVQGYQRCLQALLAGDRQVADLAALLTQRCLRYTGLQIFEYLRTGYEFDSKLWHQLHSLFAFAEEQDFPRREVADALHPSAQPSTCLSVYAKTLLACHVRPFELTRGQLQLLDRWLTQWRDVFSVEHQYAASKEDAPPLAVDLASDQGLQAAQFVRPGSSVRYLPMVPLSKLLRVKTILLQQGQSAEQLELGPECSSSDCAEFLNLLHRYCCEPAEQRKSERHTVASSAELCFGIEAIYAHIAHKPFKAPRRKPGDDSAIYKQIVAFGEVLSDTDRFNAAEMGFALEQWQIENESLLGSRVVRVVSAGGRVGVHHLVALKPSDASAFIIGRTSWLVVTQSGQLRMGIQYFPGIAEPIAIREQGLNASLADRTDAALLLPAVPALKTPPSLIVPREFFHANHLAEITHLDGKTETVKMGFSVDKGGDYERISFAPA